MKKGLWRAAALILPVLGVWGWLALSAPPPLLEGVAFAPAVLDAQGRLLRLGLTPDEKYRVYTPLHEIAPDAVRAALLYEDRHFYRHPGVNPLALGRAALSMLAGGRRMGGSTITMQVARLRLGLDTTGLGGKLVQMLRAVQLEYHYSKAEILEAYFNLAPYGGNVEGIGAAARIYFHAPPGQLSLAQCLALTPVPQNPARRWPLGGADFGAARQRMHALWRAGSPDAAGPNAAGPDVVAAGSDPVGADAAAQPDAAAGGASSPSPSPPSPPLPPLTVHGPAALPFGAPHLAAELLPTGQASLSGRGTPQATPSQTPPSPQAASATRTPPHAAATGATSPAQLPQKIATRSSAPIRTYIDSRLQRVLESAVARFAARGRAFGLHNAAALLVHWPDMQVRALVGSADFHKAAIAGQVDGTRARRSPGSTLKPFIYALALDQGLIHPQTLLPDAPRSFSGYDPENFDRDFRGPLPAHAALRASRNVPAVWLASRLSPGLWEFLRRAQVRLDFSAEHYGLALVLGGAEVSMRELAGLYAMLANGGVWRPLRLHEGQDAAGADGPGGAAGVEGGVPLLSPEAAHVALRMLEDDAHRLRTRQGSLPLRLKTGTSNGFRDAWTAGVVGPYVLVVWAGNFDNTANPLLVGGDVAAPLFEDMARALSLSTPLPDLLPPQAERLRLARLPVCTDTGDLDVSLCRDVTETWYIPGRSPTRPSGVYRAILVDTETGLRACRPEAGRTREEIWEFWPSDLKRLFLRAGVVKPEPPAFGPECAREVPIGSPPRILTPKEGLEYTRRLSDPGRSGVALTASVDADARGVFWFSGERYIGRSKPGETLVWQPDDGTHRLRAVDDLGRSSERRVVVRTLP